MIAPELGRVFPFDEGFGMPWFRKVVERGARRAERQRPVRGEIAPVRGEIAPVSIGVRLAKTWQLEQDAANSSR